MSYLGKFLVVDDDKTYWYWSSARNPRRVFTRDELLAAVWGYDYFSDQRTVDVHIRRLRTKLAPLPHEYLTTVWGVGYQLHLLLGK